MGLSLLAGCGDEKQQIFKEAEKDLEQGSYDYALDEFTTSVENSINLTTSYRGIGICQLRMGNYEDAVTAFTNALSTEKVSKSVAKDLYLVPGDCQIAGWPSGRCNGRLPDAGPEL